MRFSRENRFSLFPELLQVTPAVDIARLMLRSTCARQ
jgi:hypothetical protein